MTKLNWITDEKTEAGALRFCPLADEKRARQFEGRGFHTKRWEKRVVQPSTWQKGRLLSSPSEIIGQFKDEKYTQALAMVVSWGTMSRTLGRIWGSRRPDDIERVLRDCAQEIRQSRSIEKSWNSLTGRLGWSDVIASKTLHFLSRSLGFENDPPVPIDNAVILKQLWPKFRKGTEEFSAECWREEDYGFEGYNRYMTAIRIWAKQRVWTTTDVEAKLFEEFRNTSSR